MSGKYRFRSDAQANKNPSGLDSKRRPLSRDMTSLITLIKQNQQAQQSSKLQRLLKQAISVQATASAPALDDDAIESLATSLTDLTQSLKEIGAKGATPVEKSVSASIAALNLESVQRKQVLALLKDIKGNTAPEFSPAGKKGAKGEDEDDPHKDTKRELLYNFLGPAGPLLKVWTDTKDEYKNWRQQTAEQKEAVEREETELKDSEADLEKKQNTKTDKLAGHTENRLKDLDKRVTALEEGGVEGEGDSLGGRGRKSKWFRRTRTMAKRRWRLMKRAMRKRLRASRVLSKRRFRLMRRRMRNIAKARTRKLRVMARRKFRTNMARLRKSKLAQKSRRALRKLRTSKVGRAGRSLWRKGGALAQRAKGWASRGWGAAKGIAGKGAGLVSSLVGKFKGAASSVAGKGRSLASGAAGAASKSGIMSKLGSLGSKGKGVIGKLATKLGGKSLAKLIPFLGTAVSAYDLATTEEAKDSDDAVDIGIAYASGAMSGATIGGTIGSFVLPGIGTAVGAVVGGVLGTAWVGIRRNWSTIKGWALKGWEVQKELASKAWEGAKKLGKKYKDLMMGLWDIGADILKKLVSWLPAPVAKMLGLDQGAGADGAGGGGGGGGAADDSGGGGSEGGGIGGALSSAGDWVKGKASAAVDAVANSDTGKAVAAATSYAKGVVTRGYEGAKAGVNAVSQAITNKANVAYDTVKGTKDALALALGFQGSSTIRGMDEAQTRAYVGNTMLTESGGKLGVVNKYGYIGQYQFGADALSDMGIVDAGKLAAAKRAYGKGWYGGGHQAFLRDSANWKIEGGQQAFLQNKKLQDEIFIKYTNANIAGGFRSGALNKNSSPEQIAAYAKAAHLKGVGGANDLMVRGKDSVDANGTSARAYAEGAARSMTTLSAKVAAAQPVQVVDGKVAKTSAAKPVAAETATAQADNFRRTKSESVYGNEQQQAAATGYTRVAASSPAANVTVNQPKPAPQQPQQEQGFFGSLYSSATAALGIRDIPLVLGDNHMVVLNSGMVGA